MGKAVDDLARLRGERGIVTIRIGSRVFTVRPAPTQLDSRTLPAGSTHKQRNAALRERMAALRRRRLHLLD